MTRPALLLAVLLAAPSSAEARLLQRLELGLQAGVARLAPNQDLGDYDQLHNLRQGLLETTFGTIGLRSACFIFPWLSVGVALDLNIGSVADRATLLLGYRGELLFHLPLGRFLPFAGFSGGAVSLFSPSSVLGRDTDPALGWTAGLKIRLGRQLHLSFSFTHLMSDGLAGDEIAHDYGGIAGVSFLLAAPGSKPRVAVDLDGDGIPNRADRCPRRAEDPDGRQDDDGCPDPP